MTVAVIIVNWNGGPNLRMCLEALRNQRRQPDKVVVVDNASSDDSVNHAEAALRTATLIRLPTNTGFARANNIAIREAGSVDFLALLNPDAFPEPGWLEALVGRAEREPTIASFASQLRLASDVTLLDGAGDNYHGSGRAWRRGHGSPVQEWPADDAEVFAACAAAALYRRDALDQAGGFDERYFCYFEDVDLGFRLRLMGYRCRYVHSAVAKHISSAVGGYRSNFAIYHGERNMVWTFVKNMPPALFFWYLPQHLVMNVASLVLSLFRRQALVVLRAKFDAIRGLPGVVRDRAIVQRRRTATASDIRRALTAGVMTPYLRIRRGNSAPVALGDAN